MKIQGIYAIRNTVSGRVYVGCSLDIPHRLRTHKSNLNNGLHTSIRFQRSWTRHGAAAFEFSILEVVDVAADLPVREQHWIDELHAACPFKARLRIANLGKKHSDESKAKRSVALKGRKRSAEAIKRTIEFWTGRKHTPESRAKMSASARARKPRVAPIHSSDQAAA